MNEIILTEGPLWHTCLECGEVFDLMELPVQHCKVYCPHCYVPIGYISVYKGEEIVDVE